MKLPRVVVYFRVSTAAQDFAAQRRAVFEYCRRRCWRPQKVYQEKRGGFNAPRTVLDRLLQDARVGAFDLLVIYKLDRLGRSSVHLSQIVAELSALKIALVSATEGVDTTHENPMASFVIKILAIVGELDRERIRERSSDGLRAARARGVRIGRPRVKAARLEMVKIIALEQDVFRRQRSIRDIAKACGVSIGTAAPIVRAARRTARAAGVVEIPRLVVQKAPPGKNDAGAVDAGAVQ